MMYGQQNTDAYALCWRPQRRIIACGALTVIIAGMFFCREARKSSKWLTVALLLEILHLACEGTFDYGLYLNLPLSAAHAGKRKDGGTPGYYRTEAFGRRNYNAWFGRIASEALSSVQVSVGEMLAEDNDLNAETAIEILSEAGLEVARAADGIICADMLYKAARGYYNLILMDMTGIR